MLLPDTQQSQNIQNQMPINWVGMSAIHLPLLFPINGKDVLQNVKLDIFVDLNSHTQRGIHMSRLYLLLQDEVAGKKIDELDWKKVLEKMISSQDGLSSQSLIKLNFDFIDQQKALVTNGAGWRSLPVQIQFKKSKDVELLQSMQFSVIYSSTCPASTALSLDARAKHFEIEWGQKSLDFDQLKSWVGGTSGLVATPHAQRSFADIQINSLSPKVKYQTYIEQAEAALQTRVQTAVKRSDEQKFAELNADNPLFCEDAVRILAKTFRAEKDICAFKLRVRHEESLHAHNAEAVIEFGPFQPLV